MPRQRGNGCGNVTRVRNSKNPYRVRVTVGYEYDEQKGKMVQKVKSLGSFKTRQEAETALVSYHAISPEWIYVRGSGWSVSIYCFVFLKFVHSYESDPVSEQGYSG